MKRLLSVKFLVLLIFAATCAFAAAGYSQDKVVNVKFATFFPPTHGNSVIIDEWGKDIETKTAGRVKVTNYTGGTLSPAAQSYDAVVKGVADATNTVLSYTTARFPLSEVMDYPLGFGSGALVASNMVNEYYNKFKPKEFDEVKIMFFHSHAYGILHTKKPVRKLEDLKGMKIRSTGTNAEFIKLLGGVPVAATMAEAYDILSKGVADGILAPWEALKGWKFGEVVKYSTENTLTAYSQTFIVCLNKDTWAKISPQDQKAIDALNKEYIKKQAAVWEKIHKEGKEFILQRGNEIIKLDAKEQARWVAASKPMYDTYIANMKAKGLPGEQVYKFCVDYLKKNSK